MSTTTQQIKEWFETAFPNPTEKQVATQAGCVLEEVAELMLALSIDSSTVSKMATELKQSTSLTKSSAGDNIRLFKGWRTEVADASADIVVTLIGLCYMLGIDFEACLAEVNRSNYTKFVDGKAIYDEHGKIAKGENYTKPQLEEFLNGRSAVSDT